MIEVCKKSIRRRLFLEYFDFQKSWLIEEIEYIHNLYFSNTEDMLSNVYGYYEAMENLHYFYEVKSSHANIFIKEEYPAIYNNVIRFLKEESIDIKLMKKFKVDFLDSYYMSREEIMPSLVLFKRKGNTPAPKKEEVKSMIRCVLNYNYFEIEDIDIIDKRLSKLDDYSVGKIVYKAFDNYIRIRNRRLNILDDSSFEFSYRLTKEENKIIEKKYKILIVRILGRLTDSVWVNHISRYLDEDIIKFVLPVITTLSEVPKGVFQERVNKILEDMQ